MGLLFFFFVSLVNGKIAGKKSNKGVESSGEASGHSPGQAGPKAGGGDAPVYAGTRSSSSPSQGSDEHVLRRRPAEKSSKPA